jgi:phosphatidylglycerophosphatase A
MLRMPLPPIAAANLRHPWRLGPAVWLATCGWVGLLPFAPGTWGALVGVPLAWGIGLLPFTAQLALDVVICLLGVPVCTAAVRRLGGPKDPGCIVLDEAASLPIAFLGLPLVSWQTALAGFLLHRLFDISKPPPARQLEALPAGWGIMADDWAAAVYANLALRLLFMVIPAAWWGM